MTDDLVKRLRLISAWKTPGGPMPTEDMVNPHITCDEAADRIEELEKQLNRLEDFITRDCVLRTEARLRIEKFKEEIIDFLEGRHG
jgi:hypothetical protein